MTPSGNLATVTDTADEAVAAPARPIFFERGLFGFGEARSFLLAPTTKEGLYWLQSTEIEALCLVLADPFRFFPGYSVDLPDIDAAYLDAQEPDDVAVLVTVTLADRPDRASTANLQGPVAINVRSRRGRQVIINQPGFGVRELLDLRL